MLVAIITICLPAMEDAHTVILNLDERDENPNTFFAVYDGHGGALTANSSRSVVLRYLQAELLPNLLDKTFTND